MPDGQVRLSLSQRSVGGGGRKGRQASQAMRRRVCFRWDHGSVDGGKLPIAALGPDLAAYDSTEYVLDRHQL